ncbi:hypothetical protein BDBG_16303 [Blastomyces gilchristii SLH14081]|uniref:Uncharacterized protein n=1 Tax=Blastomyces gilchristii (strain SLH14081) TaxID=559298 RepID=A0A179UBJ4_BLAGS|nr:uncharacterized protein BDBG_16303 [Blastomyces gilchristii SLH14081]OAT04649.1 hypothetical protein BDBG_16303 [Blastomyces gilchristii SLH14081]
MVQLLSSPTCIYKQHAFYQLRISNIFPLSLQRRDDALPLLVIFVLAWHDQPLHVGDVWIMIMRTKNSDATLSIIRPIFLIPISLPRIPLCRISVAYLRHKLYST